MKQTITLTALALLFSGGVLMASPLTPASYESVFSQHATAGNVLNGQDKKQNPENRRNSEFRAMAVTDIISDVNGKNVAMQKEAAGIYSSMGYLYEYEADDMLCALVYSPDGNEVYFQNILTKSGLSTYVKGTIDGNKITVSLPQTVAWFDYGDDSYGVNLCVASFDVDNEGYVMSDVQPQIKSVTFNINEETGEISLNLPGLSGQYMLALAYSDDSTWTGFGDFSQKYSPTDLEFLSMPEGVDPEIYSYVENAYGYNTQVAFDNGYLYIRGLCEDIPGGVVRAVYNEEEKTAYIPQNQLIGIYDGQYTIITKVVTISNNSVALGPEDAEFGLTIDLEKKEIYPAEKSTINRPYLCFNAAPDRVYYLQILRDFILKHQESYAGTPLDPFNLLYETAFYEWTGYTSFYFFIPFVSTEGNLLDENCLYYRVFMDGELMEFTSDPDTKEYMGIEGTITEIPAMFTNNNDLYHEPLSPEREVGLYTEGFETLGVQMVYRYEDTVTYSDIMTLDIATGQVSPSGIKTFTEDQMTHREYYDLQGRRMSNPGEGLFIERIHLSDGTTISRKIKK